MKRQRGSLSATSIPQGDAPRPHPAMVGRFLIEEVIGRGGMSDVYRAFDPELNRHVALKVLAPALGRNPEFTDRFIRESRVAAQLNHPHVVPIFEAGSDGDTLFIAMQLVRGVDLKTYIESNGPLELGELQRVMVQASSALDHAHGRGLLHRDVKPANLMLEDRDGSLHVYLTDFGLTKSLGTDSRITHTGELVGSVHYVSPEHLEGRELDTRTDVYSLGCVLHECLSGRPPFERDTDMAVLWAHLNAEVPRASRMRRHVPNVVDRVVARAMAKDPEERFPTCGALADSLVAALDGIALDLPLPQKKTTVPLRTRLGSLTGVGIAALLLVGSVFLASSDWSAGGSIVDSFGRSSEVAGKGSPGGDGRVVTKTRERSSSANREDPKDARPEADSKRSSIMAAGRSPSTGFSAEDDPISSPTGQTLTPTRTETWQYDLTSSDLEGLNDECSPSDTSTTGCVQFLVQADERYLDIILNDNLSSSVGAWIKQDTDNDGNWNGGWKNVCDYTKAPVRVTPGARIQILIDPDLCAGGSSPTTGDITARFFRLSS